MHAALHTASSHVGSVRRAATLALAGFLAVGGLGACSKHHAQSGPKATTTTAGPAIGPSQTVTTVAGSDFITQYGFDEVRAELTQNGFLNGEAATRSDGTVVLRLHFQGRDGAAESQSIVDGVAPDTGGAQASATSGTTLIVVRAKDDATARRVADEEAAR